MNDAPISAEVLFRAHAGYIARFLVRLGATGAELDDVVQDVFLIAHRRGGFVPGRGKPTTWLAQIALHVFANRRRGSARRQVRERTAAAWQAEVERSPGETYEAREALVRAQLALDRLDDGKRAVFVLFELEGESCETIAATLGIPVGTVYSRLSVARRQFLAAHRRLFGPAASPVATAAPVVKERYES